MRALHTEKTREHKKLHIPYAFNREKIVVRECNGNVMQSYTNTVVIVIMIMKYVVEIQWGRTSHVRFVTTSGACLSDNFVSGKMFRLGGSRVHSIVSTDICMSRIEITYGNKMNKNCCTKCHSFSIAWEIIFGRISSAARIENRYRSTVGPGALSIKKLPYRVIVSSQLAHRMYLLFASPRLLYFVN